MNFKKIFTFGKIKDVDAVQLFSVRWISRHGCYNGDVRPEAEFFTSLEDAQAFKNSLNIAYKLLKHTSNINVTIEKE